MGMKLMKEELVFVSAEGGRAAATLSVGILVEELDRELYSVSVNGQRIGVVWPSPRVFDNPDVGWTFSADPSLNAAGDVRLPGFHSSGSLDVVVMKAVGHYLVADFSES